jgi:hypothetical protein
MKGEKNFFQEAEDCGPRNSPGKMPQSCHDATVDIDSPGKRIYNAG